MYFRMKFALFFRFFDSWYIIKYLLTDTSGKQYIMNICITGLNRRAGYATAHYAMRCDTLYIICDLCNAIKKILDISRHIEAL